MKLKNSFLTAVVAALLIFGQSAFGYSITSDSAYKNISSGSLGACHPFPECIDDPDLRQKVKEDLKLFGCYPFPECENEVERKSVQDIGFGCYPYPQCLDDPTKLQKIGSVFVAGCSPHPECVDDQYQKMMSDLLLFGCSPYPQCEDDSAKNLDNHQPNKPSKEENRLAYSCKPFPECEIEGGGSNPNSLQDGVLNQCNPFPECVIHPDWLKMQREILLFGCSPFPECADERDRKKRARAYS